MISNLILGQTGSGGVSIAEDMFFTDIAERDTFTTANPSRLKQGITCAVNVTPDTYDYFQYDEDEATWKDANLIFQGRRGEKGDEGVQGAKIITAVFNALNIDFGLNDGTTVTLLDAINTLRGPEGVAGKNVVFEFSIDGFTDWVDESTFAVDPDTYSYWRWSTDGGATWSPNGVRVRASVEDLPSGWGWFADANENLLLKKDGATILQISLDELKSKRLNALNSQLKFGASKTMYDSGENISFLNRTTDVSYYPVWQSTAGEWEASIRKKGEQLTRYNNSTFRPFDNTNSIPYLTTLNAVESKRIESFFINSTFAYTDCTLVFTLNGVVEVTVDKIDINSGENEIIFKDFGDRLPFIDVNEGQTFTITLTDGDGNAVQSRPFTDDGTKSWWAISGYKYEDVNALDSTYAGNGLSYDDTAKKVNLGVATNSQLGGVKVGLGLGVDGDGTIYSTVTGSIVVEVADDAERLALPQIAQAYICVQNDVKLTYFLDANTDPSVDGNWKTDGSENTSVTGFKGKKDSSPRTGVVSAEKGDYTADEITYTDKTNTSDVYTLKIDNKLIYFVKESDGSKLQVIDEVTFKTLNDIVTDPVDGLQVKVADLIDNPTVTAILPYEEAKVYPKGYPIEESAGILKWAKQDGITGVYDSTKWEAVKYRDDKDAINFANETGVIETSVGQGTQGFNVTSLNTDTAEVAQTSFNFATGRWTQPNKTTIGDADPKDVTAKEDVAITSDKMTWSNTEKRPVATEEPTNIASDSKDLIFKKDIDSLAVGKETSGDAGNNVNVTVNDTQATVNITSATKTGSYSYNPDTKRMSQDAKPSATATLDNQILTKGDGDALYKDINDKPVSSGYFQQTADASDDWSTLCTSNGITIECRNPATASLVPVRIVNNTGFTLTHVWDILEEDNTWKSGATGSSTGGNFGLVAPANTSGARRRVFVSAYKNGNGTESDKNAWTYEIVIKRISTTGYRIVGTISSF